MDNMERVRDSYTLKLNAGAGDQKKNTFFILYIIKLQKLLPAAVIMAANVEMAIYIDVCFLLLES